MAITLPQDKFVTVKDIRTRYWEMGDQGPAVLLVHGLGGFIENWSKNIVPLSEHHRVFALDLLGFGQTDKIPLVNDIFLLAQFINEFFYSLNIGKASLVGNSLGGGLALQFALDHPEKVEKLVLVDNAGMGKEVLLDFRVCTIPVLNKLLLRGSRESTLRLLKKLVYDESKITPEFLDIAYKYGSAPGASASLLSTLCAGINFGGQKGSLIRLLQGRLNTLKAPALIIWGKQDEIIPVSHADIAAKMIPGARLEIIDNCGHIPMFECPEKFNSLVLDFLDGR
jgi:pimeloyl-ACP methyl ester carboxylesterase